jgi:hypothetical protein
MAGRWSGSDDEGTCVWRVRNQAVALGPSFCACKKQDLNPFFLGEMRAITILEKVQKSLDFDGRRALTEFASARRAGVDSQAQGMTIRLLPKTFAVARAIAFGCA